jgi:hypothetical protein
MRAVLHPLLRPVKASLASCRSRNCPFSPHATAWSLTLPVFLAKTVPKGAKKCHALTGFFSGKLFQNVPKCSTPSVASECALTPSHQPLTTPTVKARLRKPLVPKPAIFSSAKSYDNFLHFLTFDSKLTPTFQSSLTCAESQAYGGQTISKMRECPEGS